VLGVFPLVKFAAGTRELESGDRVILFTDGVTEASDSENEEYGESRLLQLLNENRGASAVELQRKILTAAGEFCRGQWHDDATLIVIAVE
jgi:sigma-B regulation protein RsbU (phosphoserine phosphatase)